MNCTGWDSKFSALEEVGANWAGKGWYSQWLRGPQGQTVLYSCNSLLVWRNSRSQPRVASWFQSSKKILRENAKMALKKSSVSILSKWMIKASAFLTIDQDYHNFSLSYIACLQKYVSLSNYICVQWQQLAILIYIFLLNGLITHLAVISHLPPKEKRQIDSIFQTQLPYLFC